MLKLVSTVLLLMVALPSAVLAQPSVATRRVLVLHWYDRGYFDDIKLDQELHAALESSALGRVEYYSEYLDTNRFPGTNQALILRDYLERKYSGVAMDLVFAITNPPLDFLLKYRSELFPHTPIIFTIGAVMPERRISDVGATGIVTANTFRETVDLALRLHPGTKQLLVISGTLNHDKSRELAARTELEGFKNKLVITYLTDLSVEELTRTLKDPPGSSIALYLWQQVLNREGNVLESGDVFSRIASEAMVPLYGMAPTYIGAGMTGGYVWTLEADAKKLAEIAQRVANGERPEDIPVENAPKTPMFDWRQLQRWHIREDRLPPGSVILFRELTFWQQYKWRVAGTVSVVLVQALLIGALLVLYVRGQRRAAALVEAERVLRESEERFRRVFEEGPLGLALVGKDYRFVKVNSALCQMVGYDEAELVQMSFVDITYPDDVRADVALAEKLFRREIPFYRMQKRYVKKTGELIWINLSASMILNADNGPLYGLAMVEDITEIKRAQEEALLRQKLESLGTLAGGIAHDFNNLLGAVQAQTDLALAELDTGLSCNEELQTISDVAMRGAEIVRQLMIYAGAENSAIELVDLSTTVDDMLSLLRVSVTKRALIQANLGRDLPPIRASGAQIRQVVMNLITNASDAIGDRGGVIRVITRRVPLKEESAIGTSRTLPESNYVQLEVSDTGQGMSQETRERLFDPFFTTKSPGRGLGLAVVSGIVRNLGGSIRVTSELHKGTSFQILLPCVEATLSTTGRGLPTIEELAAPSQQAAVLIVDDEEALRQAVAKRLRKNGFDVFEAADGSFAIDLLRANGDQIDVILLDMTIPGASSREVVAEAIKVRSDITIVLASAYSRETFSSATGVPQIRGFIRKPFQFADLMKTLQSAMPV